MVQFLNFSTLLFLICLSFVSYESWQCFSKYLSKQRSVDMTHMEQKSSSFKFPSITLCPEYYAAPSTNEPRAYHEDILEECNKTGEELEGGWFGSDNCDASYVLENALPKIEDFDIKEIKILFADGYNFVLMEYNDPRLQWKNWIVPGLGQCFTMTMADELTKVNKGVGNLKFTFGLIRFRIFLHSLGRFGGWPAYATGVGEWNVRPSSTTRINMENLDYMQYLDADLDGKCNDDQEYLQDECLADLAKNESLSLGCQIPYGEYRGPLCQNEADAYKAKEIFWNVVDMESICKIPCQYLMSAIATKSVPVINQNVTTVFFTFKKYSKKSTSRVAYGVLEMVAEVGGYVGLCLGLSIFHLGVEFSNWLKEVQGWSF